MKYRFRDLFNNRKTLYLVLSVVLVSIFSLTIVYAALNTVLNITGNAEVVASNWNIHLDNVQVKSGSVGGVAPKITNSTTVTFSTKLTIPGDFYEFSIDVVNDGTIDAMIDSISKTPTLTEIQARYLNYIVEYENGNTISTKQLVKAESFVRLKVRVEFRKDLVASDLPSTSETLDLSFTVNYVQSDNTGNVVVNNGILTAMVKSGTGTDVGDEICIGNECFYVISSTDTDVTMLAKYNLHVGNKYDGSTATPLENSTGIQDETAKGRGSGYSVDNPTIGTKPFSSTNYWSSTVSTYPVYIYNENSYLYEYVENYKTYLERLGTEINEARLITIEELENLGCSRSGNSCESSPSWVYSTTYWSGAASSSFYIWCVYSDIGFGYDYYANNYYGVRPVITISKAQILGINSSVKPVVNGDINKVGTVVTIGSEQFYTIGTEGDNVKLLAKYNLLVGNKYDNTYGPVSLENPTGKQDDTAIGWFNGFSVDNPLIGGKIFSSTNYWASEGNGYLSYVYNNNSSTYQYVESYKNYLVSLGKNIIKTRLISYEELESLGCSGSSKSCSGAPSWVYTTSYWTGTTHYSNNLWTVFSDSSFSGGDCNSNGYFGIRPVVVISKFDF